METESVAERVKSKARTTIVPSHILQHKVNTEYDTHRKMRLTFQQEHL